MGSMPDTRPVIIDFRAADTHVILPLKELTKRHLPPRQRHESGLRREV